MRLTATRTTSLVVVLGVLAVVLVLVYVSRMGGSASMSGNKAAPSTGGNVVIQVSEFSMKSFPPQHKVTVTHPDGRVEDRGFMWANKICELYDQFGQRPPAHIERYRDTAK